MGGPSEQPLPIDRTRSSRFPGSLRSSAARAAIAMGGALCQRLAVLLIVALGVFALLELAQGDAVDAYLASTGGGDVGFAATLRTEFGLDGTIVGRGTAYMVRLATLDLGRSVSFGRQVSEVLRERLPVTLLVMAPAVVLTAALGTMLAIAAAPRPGGARDVVITGFALVANATPGFVVALLLLLAFTVKLPLLPPSGIATFRQPGGLAGVLDTARHLVLPVTTLTITYLALYVRVARSVLVAAIHRDYVRTARAKGVGGWRLTWRHRLRPALGPLVALFGVQAGAMLGGSIVVETVFAVPGYGSLAATAVAQRDTVLLAGVILSGAVMVMAANAMADLAQQWLDPRLRSGTRAAGGG